jgi:phosphinothricin acetyltransferase
MKNDVVIRKAELKDVKYINEIFNHYIRTSHSNWAWTERSYRDAVKWYEEHNSDKLCIFVAEKNSQIAGYGSLSELRNREGYWPVVENSVYVDKGYTGEGIGKKLLKTLIDRAKECDIWAISAWIDSGNLHSIEVHKKFGFYIAGELKNIGEKFGEKRSVTIMQLDFHEEGS